MGIGLGIQASEVCMKPNFPIWLIKDGLQTLSFDGVNDYIQSDDHSSYWGLDEYSMSFWINVPIDPGGSSYFGHFGFNINVHPLFNILNIGGHSSLGWAIYSGDGSGSDAATNRNMTDISYDPSSGDDTIWRNQWNLVVFTWNKDTNSGKILAYPGVVGYLNDVGVQMEDHNDAGSPRTTTQLSEMTLCTTSGHTSISPDNTKFVLGAYVGSLPGLGHSIWSADACKFSHVAFYNKALTEEQILNLKTGLEPKEINSCIHTWSLHGGGPETADLLVDKGSAASGTNFSVVNMPTIVDREDADFNYPNTSSAN